MNAGRKHKTRSRAIILLLIVLLALLAGAFWVKHRWEAMLAQNNIEYVQWQGTRLGLHSVSVAELKAIQLGPERRLTINARDITLGWHWGGGSKWQWQNWLPQLNTVNAQQLELEIMAIEPESAVDAPSAIPAFSIFEQMPPQLPLLNSWLPSRVRVQRFHAILPCASGRCSLQGALDIQHSAQETDNGLPINASLSLEHQGHRVDFVAEFASIKELSPMKGPASVKEGASIEGSVLSGGDNPAPGEQGLQMSATVDIDNMRNLTLETRYRPLESNTEVHWQGSLAVPELPNAEWLIAWVQSWTPLPQEASFAQPEQGSVSVRWDLQGPRQSFFAKATGTVNAEARVPQPWPVPGLGSIKGDLALALALNQGNWQPQTLSADLALTQPAHWAATLPVQLRPQQLELSVRPASALPGTASALPGANKTGANKNATNATLPLQVALRSHGAADINVDAHLAISTSAPWQVQLAQTRLTADLARLDVGQWRIDKPELDLLMSGELTSTEANLTFAQSSRVSAAQIKSLGGDDAEALELQNPQLALAGNNLTAGFKTAPATLENLTFSGPLDISAKQIKYPQLLTQRWQFNGKTTADMNGLQLSGIAKANSGTSANINLKVPYGNAAAPVIVVNAQMRVSGKREIDGLGRVLVAWPELLDASGGTISANVNAQLLPGQPLVVDGKLVFLDVGGTWDRTAWRNMNGTVEATLKSDQFQVSTSQLTLDEVNPGIPLGPIVLAGDYRAPAQRPMAGQLTLTQANAGALGGALNIASGSWDISSAPFTVPLELDRLNLAQLLRVYPAEGLAGTGILSGTIPLLIDPATGVRVKRGRLGALEPGGQLQLSAERLRALGQKNETMELVSKALENFRYSALSSDIDYDENGTLMLGLHLQGNSPEVGDGRAVVLNINLEENIPALLTSLQLSGRVTDAVAERVKKLLKKREREPAEDLIK
ncbi:MULTISPECIES: YdbH domain-containing protein [unclassified Marinobacter]|uniref:intermembrane phospholipid transport protein YdbH family protein n=1 Tax=unclassified Marinobacter TaxID=83889 RepID=UPI00200F3776|nr:MULTISPECIES: YdbH domain-containing protein [unclassified Marinobacter]UQG57338.1 YdbH domain-containing protein [Marinobacter sp. M4C]UQG66142.1 YdbH domain-containing protein [Marinobacter sp. M2C]UQG70422.1 YdbH domain-containing protein [Marinobacter sp. M1C]